MSAKLTVVEENAAIAAGIQDFCVIGDQTQFDHRSLVIRSACDLEVDLREKLAEYFKSGIDASFHSCIEKEVLGDRGIINSLKKMATIAFSLKLIDRSTMSDLIKIYDLRNEYAHKKGLGKLDGHPELVEILKKTNCYNKFRVQLDQLRPQKIFLAIFELLTATIKKI